MAGHMFEIFSTVGYTGNTKTPLLSKVCLTLQKISRIEDVTMSNIVANPNLTALTKEMNALIGKYRDYLRSIDTDVRIVRDD